VNCQPAILNLARARPPQPMFARPDETWQMTLPLFTRKGPGLIYNVHVAILETRPP
jgi:hypothetical protein